VHVIWKIPQGQWRADRLLPPKRMAAAASPHRSQPIVVDGRRKVIKAMNISSQRASKKKQLSPSSEDLHIRHLNSLNPEKQKTCRPQSDAEGHTNVMERRPGDQIGEGSRRCRMPTNKTNPNITCPRASTNLHHDKPSISLQPTLLRRRGRGQVIHQT
jgi:hypothetical protein